jgi:hypothetical protein
MLQVNAVIEPQSKGDRAALLLLLDLNVVIRHLLMPHSPGEGVDVVVASFSRFGRAASSPPLALIRQCDRQTDAEL